MAQGLNPSTRPIKNVKAGSPSLPTSSRPSQGTRTTSGGCRCNSGTTFGALDRPRLVRQLSVAR